MLLLTPALIVIASIFLLIKLVGREKGSFFYRGERLGKNKKPFLMYKIRTLAENAEQELGAVLLSPGSGREIKFGKFLRETRLDELPQLFNVLKGDMCFVGPRPIRRVVYEKWAGSIPDYDRRFDVKPGLTGYSQFFTTHRSPKRIRSLIDNHFLGIRANPLVIVLFVVWTAFRVLRKTLVELGYLCRNWFKMLYAKKSFADHRRMKRIRGEHLCAYVTGDDRFYAEEQHRGRVFNINYEAICLETDLELAEQSKVFLVLETYRKRTGRRKRAKGVGIVYRELPGSKPDGMLRYVVFYDPVSDFNRYIIDQYMLRETMA